MSHDQVVVIFILAATILMFMWGRWRRAGRYICGMKPDLVIELTKMPACGY